MDFSPEKNACIYANNFGGSTDSMTHLGASEQESQT